MTIHRIGESKRDFGRPRFRLHAGLIVLIVGMALLMALGKAREVEASDTGPSLGDRLSTLVHHPDAVMLSGETQK